MLNTCWCTATIRTMTSILKWGTARERATQCIWLLDCQTRKIFFKDLIPWRVKCVLCQPPAALLNAAEAPPETKVSPPLLFYPVQWQKSDLNFCQGCTGAAKVTGHFIEWINHWKYSYLLPPMQSMLLRIQLCNHLQLRSRKHWATPQLQIPPHQCNYCLRRLCTSRNWCRHLANLPTRHSCSRIQNSIYWAKASW